MDKDYLMQLGICAETADAVLQTWQQEIKELTFQNQLREAVQAAGGRSVRAIGAMLELEQLKNADDPVKALEQALCDLKTQSGYLFEQTVPPYAEKPGTRQGNPIQKPVTLAGAIRQRYERK